MAYLTEREFKELTIIKCNELMKVSNELSKTFYEGVEKLLNICMWHDFYVIDDAKPEKNKATENIWIGNRKSGLTFFEIKLNLKTGKLTSKISREADRLFHGSTLTDQIGNVTIFKQHNVISQVLSEHAYN